jgi:hypothetical protein
VLQFVTSFGLPSTYDRVFLSIVNYVFFIMCRGKGICPTLLGICNGCVVRYIIGFDVGGPPFKFGLFTIGLGNLS